MMMMKMMMMVNWWWWWCAVWRTGGREGDAQEQRSSGTSTAARHDGRTAAELRHVHRCVRVVTDWLRFRQDQARQIPTENLQNACRKQQHHTAGLHRATYLLTYLLTYEIRASVHC